MTFISIFYRCVCVCVCVCKFTDFSEELGFNGELRRERPFGKTVFANSRRNIKSADILV